METDDSKLELMGNGSVELTLEEMFNGCEKEDVPVLHKRPCEACLIADSRNSSCPECGVRKINVNFKRGIDSGVNEIHTNDYKLSVNIIQKEHQYYTRHKENLFIWVQISLAESLCGFQKPIPSLDKNEDFIVIKPKTGKVVANEEILVVRGKGMPYLNDENQFGNLYVKFYAPLPKKINRDLAKKLNELLPKSQLSKIPEGFKESEVVQVELYEYE